jgi:hypothetical protein
VSQADHAAAEVQSAIQSKLDIDPDLSPLHRGTSHDVSIDVTADGDKTMWEAGRSAIRGTVGGLTNNMASRSAQPFIR